MPRKPRCPLPNQVKAVAAALLDLPVRAGAQYLFPSVSTRHRSTGNWGLVSARGSRVLHRTRSCADGAR